MSAAKAVPPAGVVTFLFTDVEGSTRRWETDADAMRTALAAHDELLRKTIESHGGRSRDAMRRGLVVAQESGNRYNETHLANLLGRLEARYGNPLAALDFLALAIRNYHDSGNSTIMRVPLGHLATFLGRLGRDEPAATIAGYAFSSITEGWIEINSVIAHLRDVLGDESYESLARNGEPMTPTAITTYAFDQIDQARAELSATL